MPMVWLGTLTHYSRVPLQQNRTLKGGWEFAGDVEKAPGKAMERVSLFMSQTSPRCLVEGSSAGGASAGSFWLSG